MMINDLSATRRRRRHPRGMSLIELLIATVILAIVFVGILPLFTRSIISNRRGAESSRMAAFLNTSIESINQISVNYRTFNTSFLSSDELDTMEQEDESGVITKYKDRARQIPQSIIGTEYTALPTTYWSLGPRDSVSNADAYLGDEGWVSADGLTGAEGQVLWLRDVYIYNYELADVHIGTIDVGTQSSLVQLGHPKLFDSPVEWDQSNPPDIREVRVIVRSSYGATPIGPGGLMALGHYRVF